MLLNRSKKNAQLAQQWFLTYVDTVQTERVVAQQEFRLAALLVVQ